MDRLDVAAIRVKHERSVIPGVILWSQSRCAVVPAASGESRFMKRIHSFAIRRLKRYMDVARNRLAAAQPKDGLLVSPEADMAWLVDIVAISHQLLHTQRSKRSLVKGNGAFEVANRDAYVIQHNQLSSHLIELETGCDFGGRSQETDKSATLSMGTKLAISGAKATISLFIAEALQERPRAPECCKYAANDDYPKRDFEDVKIG